MSKKTYLPLSLSCIPIATIVSVLITYNLSYIASVLFCLLLRDHAVKVKVEMTVVKIIQVNQTV